MWKKADLEIQSANWGNHAFSELTEVKSGKKSPYIVMYFKGLSELWVVDYL